MLQEGSRCKLICNNLKFHCSLYHPNATILQHKGRCPGDSGYKPPVGNGTTFSSITPLFVEISLYSSTALLLIPTLPDLCETLPLSSFFCRLYNTAPANFAEYQAAMKAKKAAGKVIVASKIIVVLLWRFEFLARLFFVYHTILTFT